MRFVFPLLLAAANLRFCGARFNEEVVERIYEHLDRFMSRPREILDFKLAFRRVGGFHHGMGPADRDTYFAVVSALSGQPNTFYALEDGTFMGIAAGGAYAFYKEYGDTLYEPPASPDDPNWKYWIACVNSKTGEPENCTTANLKATKPKYWVECIDDCKLAPCPDPDSQRDCSSIPDLQEAEACRENVTYCPQYRIFSASKEEWNDWKEQNVTFGYIPRMYHCIDDKGRVTQEPGSCYYENDSPVQRNILGDYAYCQGKGGPCNPFVGNYRVSNYDARYRPFYTIIREWQKPLWAKPDVSFNSFEVSYSTPIYSTDELGRKVFDGVMAMDYDLRDITQYLHNAYAGTDIAVALFEQEEPHYLIASSTGSSPVFGALVKDPGSCPHDEITLEGKHLCECPYEETSVEGLSLCDPFRVPLPRLTGHPTDKVLVEAFKRLEAAGFPRRELLTLNSDNDLSQTFYVATTAVYEKPDTNLTWSFIVVMPGQSSGESLTRGEPGFMLVCAVATFGAGVCLFFLVTFLFNRHKKAIMMADWRFTCLFFLGCACLNLASFSFLGKNTDAVCLLRMWSFHMAFVAALSPLLAKCFRMRMLVSQPGTVTRRRRVTHFQTFMIMLPPIVLQAAILLVVTLVDPPTASEVLKNPGTVDVTQHVVCSHNTQGSFIFQILFEGSLTLTGTVLAYHMRHIESKFGEAKQLIFAMSSILGMGIIILIFSSLLEYDDSGRRVLYAVGICWGTTVCCCAFALPRLLTTQNSNDSRSSRRASQLASTAQGRAPAGADEDPSARNLSH
ncbi:expressed unknown protein [Seminavis robusta]|uniref:G-protein coupled receptors family 3 profile domain-containing protein n=1 Tax=Seminavis robusta TaxID=568900 RepID=A0A9N8ER37_9STRA|nr:expressed unknown protein [Seminavis robusta]|eukprot:Sro1380_g267810.1 n/a (789) ;mRNA; f:24328-26694